MPRLPIEQAVADPAFLLCLAEAVDTIELVQNFDRLYGAKLSTEPSVSGMRAYSKFVHECIYMRLPEEAIEALRATARMSETQSPESV